MVDYTNALRRAFDALTTALPAAIPTREVTVEPWGVSGDPKAWAIFRLTLPAHGRVGEAGNPGSVAMVAHRNGSLGIYVFRGTSTEDVMIYTQANGKNLYKWTPVPRALHKAIQAATRTIH